MTQHKSKDSEIAVLQTQMTTAQKDITEMKGDIKRLPEDIIKALDDRYLLKEDAVSEVRISDLEKSKNREWIRNTASAILGGVLVFLIINALKG